MVGVRLVKSVIEGKSSGDSVRRTFSVTRDLFVAVKVGEQNKRGKGVSRIRKMDEMRSQGKSWGDFRIEKDLRQDVLLNPSK